MKSFQHILRLLVTTLAILTIFSIDSNAQTYNMRDTTVTHCTGTLFDTGGSGSDYDDDEDSTFTITVPNGVITLTFNDIDLRNSGDTLYIYDGPDTNAAYLAGPFVGDQGSSVPDVTSSGQSVSIRFRSNGSQKNPGYDIDWYAGDTINVALSASNNPFCLGTAVTFTVTDSALAGNPDFAWEINSSAAAGSSNSYAYTTSSLAFEDTVRVIMTGELGSCYFLPTDSSQIVMDTIVEVFPSVSISAADYGICNGETAIFTVIDSTEGGTNPTFQWQVDGVNVGTDSYQYSTNTLIDNNMVRVIMNSNSTGCLALTNDTSSVITMNVNNNPSVVINSQIDIACFGVDTGSAVASATGGSGAITYSWNTIPVQNTATATNLSAGAHLVTATDDSSCFDTVSVIIFSPAPITPVFTVTDASTYGGADGSIMTAVTGGYAAVDYTYSWNTNPVQTTKNISGLISKTYIITITDDTNCVVIDSAFVDQPGLLLGGTIQAQGGGATKVVCDGLPAGVFTELTAAAGGSGPFEYTWQYSNNFINWIDIPQSDSIAQFTYDSIISADRFLRRKLVDQGLNDSAFSNAIFLDYVADLSLGVSGLNSPYCKSANDVLLTGTPSGGVFSPPLYTTGNFFEPRNTPGSGPNYVINYTYTDGNGCISTQAFPVVVNDTVSVAFTINPTYTPTSNIDTLNPKATPAGGVFSGIGVYQTSPGTYVFNPSVPAAGTTVEITYAYTNAGNCTTTIKDSTTIISNTVSLTGFQPDLVYCPYDGSHTVNVDLGVNPPKVVSDSFRIVNLTTLKNHGFITELGGHPGSITFNPAAYAPNLAGEYIIQIQYHYIIRDSVFQLLPLPGYVYKDFPRLAVQNVAIVQTGQAQSQPPPTSGQIGISSPIPNSDGSIVDFQYCENLTSVPIYGIYPNFGSGRTFIHSFSTSMGSGIIHANNTDTAIIDLTAIAGSSDVLTYTFRDSASNCATSVNRNLQVDVLPTPTLNINDANDFCANDGKIFVSGMPYDTTNSFFYSKNNTLAINKPFSQVANFDAADSTVGTHTLYYEFTNAATGCVNRDSSTFNIDTVPDVSISIDTPSVIFIGSQATVCTSEDALLVFGEVGGVYTPNVGSFTATTGLSPLNNSSTKFNANTAGAAPFPGHQIKYRFTDLNGCKDSTTINIVVNSLPNASFNIPPKKDSVCDVNDPIAMIANTLNPNETQLYSIRNTSGSTPFTTGTNVYNPGTQVNSEGQLGVDTIVRRVTNTLTQCVATEKKNVFINPNPTPKIDSLLALYCKNEGNVTFEFTPSDGNSGAKSQQGDYTISNYLKINYAGITPQDSVSLAKNQFSSFLDGGKISSTNQVTVTYFHTVDSSGCKATVDTVIDIVNLPQMKITYINPQDPISSGGTGKKYCYNLSGNITAEPVIVIDTNLVIDTIIGFGNKTINPPTPDYNFSTALPINPGVTASYPVTYYFTDTVTGCSNFKTGDVLVERPDTAYFEFSNYIQNLPICITQNEFVNFQNRKPASVFPPAKEEFWLNDELLTSFQFKPATTDSAKVGINLGKYIYTTAIGCKDSISKTVEIFPNPEGDFITPLLCAGDSVEFTENHTIAYGTIDSVFWAFGDGNKDTGHVVLHDYGSPGSKLIEVRVKSDQGCEYEYQKQLNFEEAPNIEFSWKRSEEVFTNNGQTINDYEVTFYTKASLTTGDLSQLKYKWNLGDGTILDTTGKGIANPTHTYTDKSIKHEVTVECFLIGCKDTRKKEIILRPGFLIDSTNAYFESFDDSISDIGKITNFTGGWELEYDIQYDSTFYWFYTDIDTINDTTFVYNDSILNNGVWEFGKPNKEHFHGGHGGVNSRAWVTGLDTAEFYRTRSGKLIDGDTTYVTSPIFDFSYLKSPMMKVWIKYDMYQNDGVVLEYTTDPGLNDKTQWTPINSESPGYPAGINWFNEDGIASSPGKQTAAERNVGWTNVSSEDANPSQPEWVQARHDLRVLHEEPFVRFRFAIGSNTTLRPDTALGGFAFDDIWIGETERNVLIETFVNNSAPNIKSFNDNINNILETDTNFAIGIQYHTNFPGNDLLNIDNQAHSSARKLYYGVNQVPSLRLDGFQYPAKDFNFKQLQLRSLEEPLFYIQLKTSPSDPNFPDNLDVTATIRAKKNELPNVNHIVNNVSLHLVLVEKSIEATSLSGYSGNETVFKNTMKTMAPTAAGYKYTNAWDNLESSTVNYNFNTAGLYDKSQWKVVAFVQDNSTKEVYQAVFNDNKHLLSENVGIKDADPIVDTPIDAILYPNPTQDEVNIRFTDQTEGKLYVTVVNQLGKLVTTDLIPQGIQLYEISTANYAEGLYFVVLVDEKGNKLTKKLLIVR